MIGTKLFALCLALFGIGAAVFVAGVVAINHDAQATGTGLVCFGTGLAIASWLTPHLAIIAQCRRD